MPNNVDEKFIQAIKSSRIDTADYILLSTKILSQELILNTADAELSSIRESYARHNYQQALEGIQALRDTIKNTNEDLYKILLDAEVRSKNNDDPEKNQTRRYSDTNLSSNSWGNLPKNHFVSYEKLSTLIQEMNPEFHASKNIPIEVKALSGAEKVIGEMREFGEITPAISNKETELKKVVLLQIKIAKILRQKTKKYCQITLNSV